MPSSVFTPPGPLDTAVLFIVFNRPDITAAVFEAIRQAKPRRLYVAADGAREGNLQDVERVTEVRDISTAVDWNCELKTLFRSRNVGCQFGPKHAIDWFFKNEEFGIILEDDCLPSESFFWFCQTMLEKFKNDEAIMAVTGTNITTNITFDADYFFSKYPLMWGWATWRRAWEKYDSELADWRALRETNWLESIGLGGLPFVYNWRHIFDRTILLGHDATWWDYQWIYTCWINNGLTIAPRKNLIKNLGFSEDATHTVNYCPILGNLQLNDITWPLRSPSNFSTHAAADAFITRNWFKVSWSSLVKSSILNYRGFKLVNNFMKRYLKKLQDDPAGF